MPRTYELTSPVYDALEATAIEAWATGEPFSQRALSGPVADALGRDPQRVAQALPQALRALERRGQYVPQRARHGSKVDGGARLTSPYAFNFTGRALDVSTLRHALAAFLLDAEVPDTAKRAVRSALRFALGLPAQCTDDVLLAAADRVPATELYELPARVHDLALRPPATLGEQTAKNYRTAVRRLLRYAGRRRLVPLIFPRLWVADPWEEAKNRYFPLAAEGPTSADLLAFRSAWSALAEAAVARHGEDGRDPARLTRAMAEQSIAYLQRVLGRHAMGYNARRALTYVARQYAEGPFAEPDRVGEFEVETAAGRRPALYLRGPNGEGVDGDWDAFLDLVRGHGLPEETVEFLTWYRDYVTLPTRDVLRQRERFPARRERLRITGVTLNERITALRALMGAAVYALEVPGLDRRFGLALPAQELTPAVLFGHHFQAALAGVETWWEARAAVLPDDAPGKSMTGALRQMVIGCGMVALALYERLRHQRRIAVATRASESGIERLDTQQEESADKTADEAAAWEAYRHANRLADALVGVGRRGTRGRRVKRENDFRDIREILRDTPPRYWIDLQTAQLDRMRATPNGERDGYRFHELVLNAMLLGLLISTGCRIEELCHVRLDVQFDAANRAKRQIRLRPQDRKNGSQHTVLVQPAFVPDDLLETYLTRTRPWLAARWAEDPAADAKGVHRQFFLVSTSGRPYGCVEEDEHGQNRDETGFKRRTNQAGRRFTVQMAQLARTLGMPVAGGKYMGGPHTVRASCGYGVFLRQGLQAAAHYLGDTETTASDAYSAIDGEHVDSSCLTALDVRPQLSLRPADAGATGLPPASRAAASAEYIAELEDRVAALTAELERRHTGAATRRRDSAA